MVAEVSWTEFPAPTSLSCQVSSACLQVVAELVGVCVGEHLFHAGKLAARLQVDAADGLLLQAEAGWLLPGPPPVGEKVESAGALNIAAM